MVDMMPNDIRRKPNGKLQSTNSWSISIKERGTHLSAIATEAERLVIIDEEMIKARASCREGQ